MRREAEKGKGMKELSQPSPKACPFLHKPFYPLVTQRVWLQVMRFVQRQKDYEQNPRRDTDLEPLDGTVMR
jgi:hypothetical protein